MGFGPGPMADQPVQCWSHLVQRGPMSPTHEYNMVMAGAPRGVPLFVFTPSPVLAYLAKALHNQLDPAFVPSLRGCKVVGVILAFVDTAYDEWGRSVVGCIGGALVGTTQVLPCQISHIAPMREAESSAGC